MGTGNFGLIQDEGENNLSVQGTLIDITGKRKAEVQADSMLRAVKKIKEFVVMLDENRRITFANEAFLKAAEYSESEILGQPISIMFSEKNPSSLMEEMSQLEITGNWEGEYIQRTRSGRDFPIRLSVSKINIKDESRDCYLAVAMDISQQKKLEQQLIFSKDHAEEMNNLKSIFLANMSHELRTPMIGILGYAGMIHEETSDPEVKEMSGAIVKSANRLTETLNLILDLSKVEANKLDVKFHKVKLASIIKEAIEHYKIAAHEKNINLIYTIPDENIYSMLDERLISQIIGNLLNNALKYTLQGKVEVDLRIENGSAVIRIIDTGIGISGDSIDLIFEPFRQVSEGYNRKFEGTGLGLTISKKFIELMNGTVEVTSEVNVGSVFTVRFARLADDKVNAEPGKIEQKKTVSKKMVGGKVPDILLVEDDPVNAQVINLFLRGYCNIDHASAGTEAIEKTKNKKYDAILMDINLKGMSGLDAVKVIRQHNEYKTVPVVAVTAYAMAGDRKRFLNSGCTHYLAKPFTKQVIIELLDSILVN